jgi:hypothetical protein
MTKKECSFVIDHQRIRLHQIVVSLNDRAVERNTKDSLSLSLSIIFVHTQKEKNCLASLEKDKDGMIFIFTFFFNK